MDTHRALPNDLPVRLAEAAAELKLRSQGPGQSSLLKSLLPLPVGAVLHAMASLDCQARFIYDSREKREDRALKVAIEELAAGMPNARP